MKVYFSEKMARIIDFYQILSTCDLNYEFYKQNSKVSVTELHMK